ncbi:family 16 glycosylhydrolase [Proteiniphilum sp.]|uniref:family 16 glycosylhydrolase n=1 Tax=Proteiniphilum sp. TaxID=1926877 RepID=UPI002B1ECBEC|nr:family 16 glycosylhydrolase [Proteiniphilum sp.]MEA4915939.1 family 16 glycosylhydrolase [Proteiniphilum sp.]
MKRLIGLIIIPWLTLFNSCGNNNEPQPPSVEVTIALSPGSLTFSAEVETREINVNSNAEWGVSSDQSWCKLSPSGGVAGNSVLKVTVERYSSEQPRTAILTFKSGKFSKQYTITQQGRVVLVDIPDAAFKTYCIANFDTDKDGRVSESEVRAITTLDVSAKGISSLQGIEKFVSLTSLNCRNNSLQTIDISGLKSLRALNCAGNQLKELDIRTNVNLENLDCTSNSSLQRILVWTGFIPTETFKKPDYATYVYPEIPTPAGYRLVWQEEFNEPRLQDGRASLLNSGKWWYENLAKGAVNNELQTYVGGFAGSDTVASIYDGTLKIVARKQGDRVISARINTSESWTYGYFEARLKVPGGKGTWPAFWMMPKNFKNWPFDGEIDIMEYVGYRPNVVQSSVHTESYNHVKKTEKTATKTIGNAETEFHVYALEWTADYIRAFVDGEEYFRFNNDKQNNKHTWPFNVPFYLKLNLAWGGDWGGSQGIDESKLPATYEIDYVRVFQK